MECVSRRHFCANFNAAILHDDCTAIRLFQIPQTVFWLQLRTPAGITRWIARAAKWIWCGLYPLHKDIPRKWNSQCEYLGEYLHAFVHKSLRLWISVSLFESLHDYLSVWIRLGDRKSVTVWEAHNYAAHNYGNHTSNFTIRSVSSIRFVVRFVVRFVAPFTILFPISLSCRCSGGFCVKVKARHHHYFEFFSSPNRASRIRADSDWIPSRPYGGRVQRWWTRIALAFTEAASERDSLRSISPTCSLVT